MRNWRRKHCGKGVEQTRIKCGQDQFLYTYFIQETTAKISSLKQIHQFIHHQSASFPLLATQLLHLLNKHLSTLSTMPITITIYK